MSGISAYLMIGFIYVAFEIAEAALPEDGVLVPLILTVVFTPFWVLFLAWRRVWFPLFGKR